MPNLEEEIALEKAIVSTFKRNDGNLGRIRIKKELANNGIKVCEWKISRILKKYGLIAKGGRKKNKKAVQQKKIQRKEKVMRQNLIIDKFSITVPNKLWSSDISEFRIAGRKLYVCAIIDVATRRIVGWAIALHMRESIIHDAFNMAYGRNPRFAEQPYYHYYVYTGYTLNTKGLEYLKKFDNFEIDNLQMLRNPDYWTKSIPYPKQIFTIEEWIDVKERLRIYKEKQKKNANRRAEKSIGTGLIYCSRCNAKFFYQVQVKKRKHGLVYYPYYFHTTCLDKNCPQSPKSVSQEKIDTILKIFVLYHAITSDGESTFLKDRLFQEEIEKKAIKEKLNVLKNNRKKTETQINKFRNVLDTELSFCRRMSESMIK